MENFPKYQQYRQLIPKYDSLQQFILVIEHLESHLKLGLIREWRAFRYLINNSKFGHWYEISSPMQDLNGFDIISYDQHNNIKFTFSVSGNQKDTRADYSIVVEDNIYIYKNKE